MNIIVLFKERVFKLVDEYSECCLLVGVCNMLKCLEDGCLYVDNMDGVGLCNDLVCLGWLKVG